MGSDGALVYAQRRLTRQQFAHAFNYCYGEPLPGRPEQYVDEESLLPNFVIGSRRVVGMTVYHYTKMLAGKSITVANQWRGVANSYDLVEPNTSAAPATVTVGSMYIDVLLAASVAHEFQNGRLNVAALAPPEFQSFDILDNDAGDGTNTRLYLRRPVRVAIPAGTFCSIYRNIYFGVANPTDCVAADRVSCVGIPQRFVTAGYYFWLPTWGLVSINQGEALGNGANQRTIVFSDDGSGLLLETNTGIAGDSRQIAGYMSAYTSGIDSGLWLQLDP